MTAALDQLKSLAGKSRLARTLVLQHRLRSGQPDWSHIVETDEYRALRAKASESPRKFLIVTSGGAYLGGTRVESLLAIALTLRGVDVHVLLCDGVLPACQEATLHWYLDDERFARNGLGRLHCDACFSPAARMYKSLGLKVHRYSDFISPGERKQATKIARETRWEDIQSLKHEGVSVGEHALAGAIRFYARSYLQPTEAEEAIVRRYLHAAMLAMFASRNAMQAERYECAVFHHGIYVPQGLVGESARRSDVRVVNWHVAYRKQCFLFSHHDTYHHTLMTEPTSEWESLEWNDELEKQTLDYLKSRWTGGEDWIHFNRAPKSEIEAIEAEVGIKFDKPTIGLLTNVMWDAQLHYPANAFPDMLRWVLKTIEHVKGRDDIQLLIRVHPAEISGKIPSLQPIVDEIAKVYSPLPRNVFIIPPESKLSTYTAMFQCDSVLIFGTKTGVELTAMGIPVIVAGEAWIRNKGITTDITSEQDYVSLLERLPVGRRLSKEVIQRARKYAYHFFFRRMIPIGFCKMTPTPAGFEFDVQALDQLRPGRDEGLDIICDGIMSNSRFVFPAEASLTRGARKSVAAE